MKSRNQREGWYAGRLPTAIAQFQECVPHSKHYRHMDKDEKRYRTAIACWVVARPKKAA